LEGLTSRIEMTYVATRNRRTSRSLASLGMTTLALAKSSAQTPEPDLGAQQ
jgi:hypothetical protein